MAFLSIYCLSILAVCGGELNMESGQLESPNYPEDYVPNKECIWVITVPIGFQVALKFQSFEVGMKMCEQDCNYCYSHKSVYD